MRSRYLIRKYTKRWLENWEATTPVVGDVVYLNN